MTALEQRIGQMLLFGWQEDDGPKIRGEEEFHLASHAKALVDELFVGGVVLFSRNGNNRDQVSRATTAMQEQANRRDLPPLFVWVDQEGGRVQRFNGPGFTSLPSAAQIGLTSTPSEAASWARIAGTELRAVGVNGNFAPVLDVNNNPANPVIGDRSYSDNPGTVATMGTAAILAMQAEAGIMTCGKHFPGHGDTDVDSHHSLPKINHDISRLERLELVPFRAAIEANVAAIMSAHILFPAIDPDLPATLSHRLLTGVLRQDLGFEGLIVTDCLEMKGVATGWGTAEAAVLAVMAGADLLLCCQTLDAQRSIRDSLLAAVRSGRITEARIDVSIERIAAAKSKWLGGK